MSDVSDPSWLVGAGGLLTAFAAILRSNRDSKRKDRIDPVALVTDANKQAYDALQGTIETLQVQVTGLSGKLDRAEAVLRTTNQKLAEVQVDLLVTKTENRVLQGKVTELTRLLSEVSPQA